MSFPSAVPPPFFKCHLPSPWARRVSPKPPHSILTNRGPTDRVCIGVYVCVSHPSTRHLFDMCVAYGPGPEEQAQTQTRTQKRDAVRVMPAAAAASNPHVSDHRCRGTGWRAVILKHLPPLPSVPVPLSVPVRSPSGTYPRDTGSVSTPKTPNQPCPEWCLRDGLIAVAMTLVAQLLTAAFQVALDRDNSDFPAPILAMAAVFFLFWMLEHIVGGVDEWYSKYLESAVSVAGHTGISCVWD